MIALAVPHAVSWGARVEGYFLCTTPPVVPCDDYPSHTLARYRHRHPPFDPDEPLSGHIAAVGVCRCLAQPPGHPRYETTEALSAAVLEVLCAADPAEFLRTAGPDGPFQGTDSAVRIGFRLHYCSWLGRGLWLSFRHLYVGK